MAEKRGFVVYFDLADSLAEFSDDEVGRIFRAMISYAANGEELPLPARERIAFAFIKTQIERDGDRYAETCAKRKAAAEARWGTENKTTQKMQMDANDANAYNDMQKMQMDANDADIDTDTEKEKRKRKEKDTEKESILPPKPPKGAEPQKRFVAPTVEMVAEYCRERNNGVDAQRFVDYYSANGWKVGGRSAMKDWKAAVRTWEGNGYGSATVATQKTEAAPVNKYAPPEGTAALKSFNKMLERARGYSAESEAAK